MTLAELLGELSADILAISLASIRILVAFLLSPLFGDELVPPLVKNSLFVTLAGLVAYAQPGFEGEAIDGTRWILLAAKEAFIGLTIGVFFGLLLWAFESAGTVLDTQIGASLGTLQDPIAGHDVTLLGDLLQRWAGCVFMAAGGLLILVTTLLDSYTMWPIGQLLPDFRQSSVVIFELQFGAFATLLVMLVAPLLAVLFLIDMLLGLINRFAKRVDVLFISMAVKGLVALLLLTILLPVLLDLLLKQIDLRNDNALEFLRSVLGL